MCSTLSLLLLACKTLGTQRPFKFLKNFNSEPLVQAGGAFAFTVPFNVSWNYFEFDVVRSI